MAEDSLIADIKKIIKWSLDEVNMGGEDAESLVFATGMAESGYKVLSQYGDGPAVGFFQCEPATMRDIWDNFVMYRSDLKTKLYGLGYDEENDRMRLQSSIALQAIFCRIKYRRDSHPLPKHDDLMAQAKYWKRVYNSHLGKGTVEHFMEMNDA